MKKRTAGAAGPPAWKILTHIMTRLWPQHKPCRCAPELWSTVADLSVVTAEVQRDLAVYCDRLDQAVAHMGELEVRLWHEQQGVNDAD